MSDLVKEILMGLFFLVCVSPILIWAFLTWYNDIGDDDWKR